MSGTQIIAPKVFISYSQDSPEHVHRVFEFSNRLRDDGIDCVLDLYEQSPQEGWPLWMIHQIQIAEFILMICTERYYKRAMGTEQHGVGHGARWEANLLFNHFYDDGTLNTKIIPIFFDEEDYNHIPDPFRGISYYCPTTDAGYEDLYRLLTGQPLYLKPELGEIRKRLPLERKGNFHTDDHDSTLHEPAASNGKENPAILDPFPAAESQENVMEQERPVANDSNLTTTIAVVDVAAGQPVDILTLANRYYIDIAAGSLIARAASRLFTQPKIYPDECGRALSNLKTLSRPIEELGKLATYNPMYFKEKRYELLRTLHLLEAELIDLETLKNAYCPGCPHAPVEQQQEILHKLEEILAALNAIDKLKQSSKEAANS